MRTRTQLTPRLRLVLRWLRRNFPADTPIVVRLHATLKDCHGACLIGDGRALIRITCDTEQVMVDTLIHEYCHVLRHECPLPWKGDHDSLYWAIFGDVSQKWWGE